MLWGITDWLCVGVILLGIFTLGFLAGGNDSLYNFLTPQTNEVNLTFGDDINQTERVMFKEIVDKLNPKYLTYVKSIYVGKNRTVMKLDSDECIEAYGEKGCGGSTLNGKIIVGWKSINLMKIDLCHELLHDYIYVKSNKASIGFQGYIHEDANHAVIDDLGQKKVCYG